MAGEAQIVDRFMTHFAERFCACCPTVFKFSGEDRSQATRTVACVCACN
jgi:Sec7-like guanine-nucleotide exchange factor